MNQEFRATILGMFKGGSGRYQLQKRNIDYDKAIAHGAVGRQGEHFYYFLYKDVFAKQPLYGAVYFLHKPFNLARPFEIGYKGDPNLREHWGFYTQAALYFLEKNFHDTLMLETAPHDLHQLHQEVEQSSITHQTHEHQNYKKFEAYDFNVMAYGLKASETPLASWDPDKAGDHVRRQAELLNPAYGNRRRDEDTSPAHLGLSLIITQSPVNTKPRFLPVLLPVKRDGQYGVIKNAVPSTVKKYTVTNPLPDALKEFLEQLMELDWRSGSDTSEIHSLSTLYFPALAQALLDMPPELLFCQLHHNDSYQPLKIIRFVRLEIRFAPLRDGDTMRICPVLEGSDGQVVEAGSDYAVFFMGHNQVFLFVITFENDYVLAVPQEAERFYRCLGFLQHVKIITIDEFPIVRDALKQIVSPHITLMPDPLPLFTLDFLPTPVLKIMEADRLKKLPQRIEVEFDYKSGLNTFLLENPHIRLVHYESNHQFEEMCLHLLKNDEQLTIHFQQDKHGDVNGCYFRFTREDELDWLVACSPKYMQKGFKIYSDRQQQFIGKTDSMVKISLSTTIHWLEFRPLLESLSTGETFEIQYIDYFNGTVTDQNGTLHIIKREDRERLLKLTRLAQQTGNYYRVPAGNFILIDTLYNRREQTLPMVEEALQAAARLKTFQSIPRYPISPAFQGTLRDYQQSGVQWLLFLNEYNLSGCLADDMGLGKTVQTLALLQTLKDQGRLETSLLVVPVSAVPNWENEIRRFTPSLTYFVHMGAGRRKETSEWREFDLLITSYTTLRNDIDQFREFLLDYVVLDESQAVKNISSQVSKAVKLLRSRRRLALSGTPIENTSMELWSLFDFLMPGFLGGHEWFRREWALPVEKYNHQEKIALLKEMIYPFILRRKKEDVEKELPDKIEIVESLQMEDEQLKLYIATAQYYSDLVTRAIDEEGLEKASLKIFEAMLRLRQICLFPHLLDITHRNIPSVKFDHFCGLMEDILSEGHNVLVFSQFVQVLVRLKEYFDQQNVIYAYLDGSTPMKKRGEEIKRFQEDPKVQVFLLSLKAGGVALNLTAADYVVIFDPWWNPAVEAQAVDRSHRIGQTKNVMVYRMVVKDTIEEKMLALQELKKDLVEKLITTETHGFKNLTREDVLKLFQ